MNLKPLADLLTLGLGPSVPAIVTAILLVLTLPLLLHLYIYRTRASTNLPAFLLVGPSGSGKTSLLTLFERGVPSQTHTSQTPLSVEVSLPVSTAVSSTQYRSVNDPSNQVHRRFLLVDTPGHGKLRHFALNSSLQPHNLKGIIFVVDAAALSLEEGDNVGLQEAAQYLHDLLLTLQARATSTKSSRGPSEMPVLIAANKLDLFTALPAKLVKNALEGEITKIRSARSKGLLDSGVGMDDQIIDEPEPLGGGGEGQFEFKLMEEYNIQIQTLGGNVLGTDGKDTSKWWDWIGAHL